MPTIKKDDKLLVDKNNEYDQEILKFLDSIIVNNQASLKVSNLQQGNIVARYISQLANDYFTSNAMIEMAINELIINAIEHGLLKINHLTKEKLLQENSWEEYITERLSSLPKDQYVSVKCTLFKNANEMEVEIIDPGEGFNQNEYENQFKAINETSLIPPKHGRGTILIKHALGQCGLKYFLDNHSINRDDQ